MDFVRSRVLAGFSIARRAFLSLADDLATTAFPSSCRVCGSSLTRASVLPVCDDCHSGVSPQTAVLCGRCGEALEIDLESARSALSYVTEGLLCHLCRVEEPEFERAVAYGVYERELRRLVHLFKYERMGGLAPRLGDLLAQAIQTLAGQAARELVVVPVPLFADKRRERGYNQSELLAQAAVACLGRTNPGWRLRLEPTLLLRTRDTRSQFELSPAGRRRNLRGAFAVDAARLRAGCEVLVLDDIYTTGTTARECARVLRRAGAAKVWIATLARAQRPRVDEIAVWDDGRFTETQRFN